MAILNIVQTGKRGPVVEGTQIPARGYGGTSEDLSASATSAQSSAMGSGTGGAFLCPDVTVRIAIGDNPTATATSARIPQDAVIWTPINVGQKIAVVTE